MKIFDLFNTRTEDSTEGIVFRDIVLVLFLAFVFLVLIFIVHLNPPGKQFENDATVRNIGNLTIFISWPDNMDIDIDTWVWTSQEKKPVGYSNREGKYLNLLRDDLGDYMDESGRNFEVVTSRGLPAGKWIINLHYYGESRVQYREKQLNIPVKVIVDMFVTNEKGNSYRQQVAARNFLLRLPGHELTAMTFYLDKKGNFLPKTLEFPSATIPLRGRKEFEG